MSETTNIFYADEDVDGGAIKIARNIGVEIITVNDAGNRTADDPTQFAYAVEHGYVFVTNNEKDFRPLYIELSINMEEHPGVIFIKSEHRKNSVLVARELKEQSEKELANQQVWI